MVQVAYQASRVSNLIAQWQQYWDEVGDSSGNQRVAANNNTAKASVQPRRQDPVSPATALRRDSFDQGRLGQQRSAGASQQVASQSTHAPTRARHLHKARGIDSFDDDDSVQQAGMPTISAGGLARGMAQATPKMTPNDFMASLDDLKHGEELRINYDDLPFANDNASTMQRSMIKG